MTATDPVLAPPAIRGGYVLEPREVLESELWAMPPDHYKLYRFLVLKATHTGAQRAGHSLTRGQVLTSYDELRDALVYYRGYCQQGPSKAQVGNILRKLREAHAVTTTKTTRGLIVSVVAYTTSQNPQSYEYNSEGNAITTGGFQDRQEGKEWKKEESRGGEASASAAAILSWWNCLAKEAELPRARGLSKSRKARMRVRAAEWRQEEGGIEGVLAAIRDEILQSAFLRGQNDRAWACRLDWLLANDTNWRKVLEGNYHNGKPGDGAVAALDASNKRWIESE